MDMDLRILSSSQALNAPPQWPTDVSNFNQQDINGLNSGQQSQAERQFPQRSTMPSLAQNSHGESSTMASTEEVPNSHNLLCQPHCYIQSQIQMNVQHTSDSHIIEPTTVDSQVPEAAPNATGPSSSQERDAKGVKLLERKLTGEGIHRNIELIWDRLKENHACKLGIYGMGGVGKTTIMMHIHNRLLEDATFDGVVFITVSQDFSIKKLQSDIWKALKCGVMEDEDEKKRAAILSEHLERKKNCVLILDDVWEHLDLEEVGIPIRAHGFKFVLTTRSFDVCCQMHCQEKIKIKPLSQIEAESLFLEELGSEVPLNSETKAIVKSIVEECAGLPIGVITMARSMRGVTDMFEWRDSLVKLEESSKGQTDMEKKVLMNLKFSYDRLW
ncbi:hypothetical protein EUGRSUZ_L01111 [Eucalyptus grandis]|uniref:AAA+ ATPase domain-containing protein n=1 Tax=Eucalyptus grandis TaxID=71139 RepID=A0A058ZUX0_EUCGR|nr:hypothetical protein EUGRSUZ_L01111 [Eucalyptus grandis]